MKERVVTLSIEAVVDGEEMSIHDITISNAVNAIPTALLVVSPTKSDSDTPLVPSVQSPSISDFTSLYNELAKKADDKSRKCSVKIVVKTYRTEGSKGDEKEEIEIKDWILTGVGLSGIDSTSAPSLSIVIEHPICNLTKVGSIYETPNSYLDTDVALAASEGKSFIDIVNRVYATLRTKDSAFYEPPKGSVAAEFRKSLGVGEFDPSLYIKESAGPLFLSSSIDPNSLPRIAEAIGRMVIPNDGASSTWDMILSMCGVLLLNIVQDGENNYRKGKLILEPQKPWKSPTIKLDEEWCVSTEVPGVDSFKISGVMARKFTISIGGVTLGLFNNGNADQTGSIFDVLYVPKGLKPKMSDGRIMRTSSPSVLNQAIVEDVPYGVSIDSAMVMMKKAMLEDFNEALLDYCQAVYEITMKSMVGASAQMALMFKDGNGNEILPGNTCSFTSRGSVIYYGYINRVVHHMSVDGGCGTTIRMSHARSEQIPKSGEVKLVENGDVNAAYRSNS